MTLFLFSVYSKRSERMCEAFKIFFHFMGQNTVKLLYDI